MPPRHIFEWLSHRDMVQRTKRSIDYSDYRFVIVHVVLGNARYRWDRTSGCSAMNRRMKFDGNPERTDRAKARARRWSFLKVPRYSMPHRNGAMVRLDTGQSAS